MLSRTAQQVLLDASPLCRFAECSLLETLREYLGSRARITREVERELLRLSEQVAFSSLAEHLRPGAGEIGRGAWPKTTKPLPDGLKADFANLLALKHAIGEHEWAHTGEIATVLIAEHRRANLVLIDDGWGASLAKGAAELGDEPGERGPPRRSGLVGPRQPLEVVQAGLEDVVEEHGRVLVAHQAGEDALDPVVVLEGQPRA